MFHIGFIYYLIILQIEKALAIIDVQTIDFQEIQNQCWSKFYSFVQQCYQVSVFVNVILRSSIYKIIRKALLIKFLFLMPLGYLF